MTNPGFADDNRWPAGDSPPPIEGEIVHDATARSYGDPSTEPPQSPFDHPDPFAGTPFSREAGALGTLRMLAGSRQLRSVVSAPLRVLMVVVALPSLCALLFAFTIDTGARVVAGILGVTGLLVAALLEFRRRRFIARSEDDPELPAAPTRSVLGLIFGSLVLLMVLVGFDLLAIVLQLFGVW